MIAFCLTGETAGKLGHIYIYAHLYFYTNSPLSAIFYNIQLPGLNKYDLVHPSVHFLSVRLLIIRPSIHPSIQPFSVF